jgi:hypothetical protein
MTGFDVIGDKHIMMVLNNIPKAFHKEAIEDAAKPGALMVRSAARQEITKQIKSTNGQSKAAYLSRSTMALRSKSRRNPGYNVYIKGKGIPVGNKTWTVQGYGVLFGEGSHKTGNRTTNSGANRGRFRGFGNPIEKAGARKGRMARQLMMVRIDRIAKATLRK